MPVSHSCGCVIAYEMEMRSAGVRPQPMKPANPKHAISSSEAQLKLVESLLALDARGSTTREDLLYLHRARKQWTSRNRMVKTRQMMTRHRMPKDKAPPASRVR